MWKDDHIFMMKKLLVWCMHDISAPGVHHELLLFKLLYSHGLPPKCLKTLYLCKSPQLAQTGVNR